MSTGHAPPSFRRLLRRTLVTTSGALQNRGELLLLEWQQEKERLTGLLLCSIGVSFLAMLSLLLFTATIVALVPEAYRFNAIAVFAVLYLVATAGAAVMLRRLLRHQPFSATLSQLQKDRDALESLK